MGLWDTFTETHSTRVERQAPSTESRGQVGTTVETVRRRQVLRADALTPAQLRAFYRKSSAVRPAVDGLVRAITTRDWRIEPVNREAYDETHVAMITDLLRNPNPNEETLQELLGRVLLDLLILDRFVIELVPNARGQVLELWARDAGTFHPLVQDSGLVTGYEQRLGAVGQYGRAPIPFTPDEIIWRVLYPRTDTAYGTPIIETIVNEISALIFSIQHIALTFTDDEIPPGILWLGGMGEEVWKRVREAVRMGRNRAHEDLKLRIFGGGTIKPEWIRLKDAPRDVQMAQLRKDIEGVVWRNFGKSPVSMGRTENVPRASAEVQMDMEDSSLVQPIVNLLEESITHHVIRRSYGWDDVKFSLVRDVEEDQEEKSRIADRLSGGRLPIFSLNQIRQKLYNEEPFDFPAAKRPFLLTGRGDIVFLDELGTAAPISSASASSVAASLIERSAPVGTLDLTRLETLVTAYTQVLLAAWNTMRARVLTDSVKGLVERSIWLLPNQLAAKCQTVRWDDRRVRIMDPAFQLEPGVGWHRSVEIVKAVEQPHEDRVNEAITLLLALMLREIEDGSDKAFAFALEIGFADALAAVPSATVAGSVRQAILQGHHQRHRVYWQENLIGDVARDLRMAIAPLYASLQDFLAAVAHAIDRYAFRLPRYASEVIAVGADAFAAMGTATGEYEIIWLDVGDERECGACRKAHAGSPYKRRQDLPFYPGQSPECDGLCRCCLRLEKITT